MVYDDFSEYKRLGEPEMAEKSGIWQAAIGLQQVDGLTPSAYLIETAKQNIEGTLTIAEVQERIHGYYIAKPPAPAGDRTEEADKVSARIAEILSEKTFSFRPAEYLNIHKRLFAGIYPFAGQIRDYNITKNEWVLGGKTVYYASADSIRATLDYDFAQEKAFDYKGLSKAEIAAHIAKFISDLWQIHAFGEGNTRTTAVFTIQYLRSFGFDVSNDLFAAHSWYFRNALVRANYNDYQENIHATLEYLNRFFAKLLLGEDFPLRNRDLHIAVLINVPIKDANVPINVPGAAENVPINRRDEILLRLRENPRLTARELAEFFSVDEKTVKRDFAVLKAQGKIQRIGPNKTGYWELLF